MHCLTALWIPSAWPLLLCSAPEWTEKMIPWCCLNLFDTMVGCISACKCLCCLVVNNSIAAKTALYLTRPSQVDMQITSARGFVPCFPMYFIHESRFEILLLVPCPKGFILSQLCYKRFYLFPCWNHRVIRVFSIVTPCDSFNPWRNTFSHPTIIVILIVIM